MKGKEFLKIHGGKNEQSTEQWNIEYAYVHNTEDTNCPIR